VGGAAPSAAPREAQIGYWLDSSTQTPEETVEDIQTHLDRAAL